MVMNALPFSRIRLPDSGIIFPLFPTILLIGMIVAEKWGGRRRIDRILIRKDSPAKVVGYAFSSVLAGLTDHIPVALSLKLTND